jgi:hypothetical protein
VNRCRPFSCTCATILIPAAQKRNRPGAATCSKALIWADFSPGTALASSVGVRLDFPRAVLIFLSITTCYARVQARAFPVTDMATEVNSCLRMVRVAASRRGRGMPTAEAPMRARSSRR